MERESFSQRFDRNRFNSLVATELFRVGYYDNLSKGLEYAKDLDMSFSELIDNGIPSSLWANVIKKDCYEMLVSEGRNDLLENYK